MNYALSRIVTAVFLGVAPVAVAILMFAVAQADGSLSFDFHNELYPEAKLLLDWQNPFPGPDADLSQGRNLIWPPLDALLVAPFTVLPPEAADWAIALAGLVSFMASLAIVGVRDWRVYGAFALWPQMIGEIRVSHLTPFLCLLLALAWRYRGTRGATGVAVGLAVGMKFFLWPLGVWLAATRRARELLVAAAVAGASLLLLLPFTSLHDYLFTLIRLGEDFDQNSYTPFGLLVQCGAPETLAHAVGLAIGLTLLLASWHRESFGLAIGAALVLSPIVWLDYYAVAAIPLAVVRPRFSAVWLLPLATWGLLSAGVAAGNAWGSARVLVVFTLVFAVVVRGEREAEAERERHRPATVGVAQANL